VSTHSRQWFSPRSDRIDYTVVCTRKLRMRAESGLSNVIPQNPLVFLITSICCDGFAVQRYVQQIQYAATCQGTVLHSLLYDKSTADRRSGVWAELMMHAVRRV